MAVVETAYVARELDNRGLQSETDAQEWQSALPRVTNGVEHPFDAADAEPTGHEQSMERPEHLRGALLRREEVAGDPRDVDARVVRDPAMNERFLHALVAVDQLRVLPDNGDAHAIA